MHVVLLTHLYILRSKIISLIVIVVVFVVKTWNTYVPKILFRMFFGRLMNHHINYFRLDCQIREYYFFLFDAHGSLFSFSFRHTWIVLNKLVGNIYHHHHHYH